MKDEAQTVRERAAATYEAGAALRASTTAERAAWLAGAAKLLEQDSLEASDALSQSTGLSVPMVQWAARTTLDTLSEDAMRLLAAEARGKHEGSGPIAMLAVLLAGNVFTASVRGIVVPLLLGVPVLAKASSRETSFPKMLRDALRRADASLGSAMDLVAFSGGDEDCEAALFEPAEAVAVYGGDETVAAISRRLGDTVLIAHGHGVSVAYCGERALSEEHLSDTVAALALDICAYDQRGCLSPQIVYVDETAHCSATGFAQRLASEGLEPLSKTLPRGPVPVSLGASQAQWRGLAEVEGTLVRGDSYAIAVRPTAPVRWSPAYRNVSVAPVRGASQALRAMKPFGANLKCVGVDPASLAEIRARLLESASLSAYACSLGEMQTPALDAAADGKPIWHGLFRL